MCVLFALLVTLSSVMGDGLEFSKIAYEAILKTEYKSGIKYTDAGKINFQGMQDKIQLISVDPSEVNEKEGIHLLPKNPQSVTAKVTGVTKNEERLSRISIVFSRIQHEKGTTRFGTLLVCFEGHGSKSHHETCIMALLFSQPKSGDQHFAYDMAIEVDPLSDEQVKSIISRDSFWWSLSSLKDVLRKDIMKKVDYKPTKNAKSDYITSKKSLYVLRPIIGWYQLIMDYASVANLNERIEEVISPDDEVGWKGQPSSGNRSWHSVLFSMKEKRPMM